MGYLKDKFKQNKQTSFAFELRHVSGVEMTFRDDVTMNLHVLKCRASKSLKQNIMSSVAYFAKFDPNTILTKIEQNLPY